ncbi:MAG: hypothetical protein JWN54_3395 [Mycobacterium sp.]|nr:hypothetical protein [Mycobacterium sp.]
MYDPEAGDASALTAPGPAEAAPGPALAARLAAMTLRGIPTGELIDVIAAWERLKCWAEAAQAAAITEFAHRRPGVDPPARSSSIDEFAADEIGAALTLSRGTAGHRIAFAVGLTELPQTCAALARGRIGLGVAHRIVDGLQVLPATEARAVELDVLRDAEGRTPGQVQARLARSVLAVDPAAAAKRHARAVADRRVLLSAQPDGMAFLSALIRADDAAAVMAVLRDQAREAKTPGDARTHDQRMADVFVDLHTERLRGIVPACGQAGGAAGHGVAAGRGGCTCTGAARATRTRRSRGEPAVRVVVAATTLLGLDDAPGELAGHGPIPADLAREIAADPTGTWQRILTDPVSGALLDVGRTSYTPPAAMAEHVRVRDRTCRFPGCRQPAERCDLDHVRRYPDGPTSRCNLCTECRHHHRLKHESDWQLDNDPDDPAVMTWTSPAGKSYTTRPRPPLVPV